MAKKFGDRKDGAKLRNIHAMHLVMPLMYPNRCDNEAFISERIDLTNILAYLDEKNASNPDYKYNFFQVMVTTMLKVITLRPKMNRFIANKTMVPAQRGLRGLHREKGICRRWQRGAGVHPLQGQRHHRHHS